MKLFIKIKTTVSKGNRDGVPYRHLLQYFKKWKEIGKADLPINFDKLNTNKEDKQ